jgi:hypothetical protein
MICDLEAGDAIEIMYRVRRQDGIEDFGERWVRAEIIECEQDAWPLARLADGQLTEVRRYMTWRHVFKAPRPGLRRLAA